MVSSKRLTWSQLSARAFKKKVESEKLIAKAAQALMLDKGFSKEIVCHFSACYAGGNETVINFYGEGEFADLDIKEASGMTRDEIIERLSRHLCNSSREIIKMDKMQKEGEQ